MESNGNREDFFSIKESLSTEIKLTWSDKGKEIVELIFVGSSELEVLVKSVSNSKIIIDFTGVADSDWNRFISKIIGSLKGKWVAIVVLVDSINDSLTKDALSWASVYVWNEEINLVAWMSNNSVISGQLQISERERGNKASKVFTVSDQIAVGETDILKISSV